MQNKKILLIVVTIIGLGLAIPFDLLISQSIYDTSNILGLLGEAFGEVPGILIGAFGCAALIFTFKKKSNYSKYSSIIFGSIFLILLSYMAAILPAHYLGLPTWSTYLIAIIYLIIVVYIVKKIPDTSYPYLRRIAWIAVLTLLSETILVNLIKFGWSRVRYRDLLESTSAFTAWFIPNGFTGNTEFTSFPSGHVANASMILFITLLPNVYPRLHKYKTLLLSTSIIWIVLIMVSRIIMGAHFLSDTIIGFWITFICLIVYQSVFKIKKEK